MYKVKCVVCGREFDSVNSRYNLCSAECRAERKHTYIERYAQKRADRRTSSIIRYRQTHSRCCMFCGKPMKYPEDPDMRVSPMKSHEKCLIIESLKIIDSGRRLEDKERNRLYSRGWTARDVKELLPDYRAGKIDEHWFIDD